MSLESLSTTTTTDIVRELSVVRIFQRHDGDMVALVRHVPSDEKFVIKSYRKSDLVALPRKLKRVNTELSILKEVRHPFIAHLHRGIQSSTHVGLLMRYYSGGSLRSYLSRHPSHRLSSEELLRRVAAEVVTALEYLHSNGWLIRDLKPENILIDASGHCVLTDFDLATRQGTEIPEKRSSSFSDLSRSSGVSTERVSPESPHQTPVSPHLYPNSAPPGVSGRPGHQRMHSLVGTVEYLCPEVIDDGKQSFAVDAWAFGVLLYECFFGVTPFAGNNEADTMYKITHHDKIPFPSCPPMTPELKDLIEMLLRKAPQKRLGARGASEIKAHKWFRPVAFATLAHQLAPLSPNGAAFTSDVEAPLDRLLYSQSPSSEAVADPGNSFDAFQYVEPPITARRDDADLAAALNVQCSCEQPSAATKAKKKSLLQKLRSWVR